MVNAFIPSLEQAEEESKSAFFPEVSVFDIMANKQSSLLNAEKEQCKQLLLEMDFTLKQIDLIFRHESHVKTIDEFLQCFEIGPLGYNHRFQNSQGGSFCSICGASVGEHR